MFPDVPDKLDTLLVIPEIGVLLQFTAVFVGLLFGLGNIFSTHISIVLLMSWASLSIEDFGDFLSSVGLRNRGRNDAHLRLFGVLKLIDRVGRLLSQPFQEEVE